MKELIVRSEGKVPRLIIDGEYIDLSHTQEMLLEIDLRSGYVKINENKSFFLDGKDSKN